MHFITLVIFRSFFYSPTILNYGHAQWENNFNDYFIILFQECPEGVVHEECFKDIYAKFFPHGSKYFFLFIVVDINAKKNRNNNVLNHRIMIV